MKLVDELCFNALDLHETCNSDDSLIVQIKMTQWKMKRMQRLPLPILIQDPICRRNI